MVVSWEERIYFNAKCILGELCEDGWGASGHFTNGLCKFDEKFVRD